jgi:hypothetical protein
MHKPSAVVWLPPSRWGTSRRPGWIATGRTLWSASTLCSSLLPRQPDTTNCDESRTGRTGWLTCWEPIDRADPRVPDLLRQVDLGAGLAAAGFDNIVVSERMDWHEAETAMWREAERLNPGSDAALAALHEEAIRALAFSSSCSADQRPLRRSRQVGDAAHPTLMTMSPP